MNAHFHPFALPEEGEQYQQGSHHHHPEPHELHRFEDDGGPAIPEKEGD